jgi:hypothetical protein
MQWCGRWEIFREYWQQSSDNTWAESFVDAPKRRHSKSTLKPNQRITRWLMETHRKLDAVVIAVYGWPVTLTDAGLLERLLALSHYASLFHRTRMYFPRHCLSIQQSLVHHKEQPSTLRNADRPCLLFCSGILKTQTVCCMTDRRRQHYFRTRPAPHLGRLPFSPYPSVSRFDS